MKSSCRVLSQQQSQHGGVFAACFEYRLAQQRIGAITHLAAVRVIVTLASKQPAVGTTTVGTHKSIRMEMPLQPQQAEAIIKWVGYRKIDSYRQYTTVCTTTGHEPICFIYTASLVRKLAG